MIWQDGNNLRFAAIVPAAGLSSRMGAFKPLLDLNGKPLIIRTLDSLRAGGAEKICVVTGYRAEELEAAAAAPDVCFVRNPEYASAGMLESVQLGLKALLAELPEIRENAAKPVSYDAFFILPGDVPLVRPETLRLLKIQAQEYAPKRTEAAGSSSAQPDSLPLLVLRPLYRGKAGHPVLLSSLMAAELLQYQGPDGLRGFLREQAAALEGAEDGAPRRIVRVIETDDPAILADADTPEEYLCLMELQETAK